MKKKLQIGICVFLLCLMMPRPAFAMHIMEGFLAPKWCILWGVITIPFVIAGFVSIKKKIDVNPKLKMMIAMCGAFAFVLSALKVPSVTGSCSHATGVGLGAMLFGPTTMSALGVIVLLFQALLLAHGGITTLGANTFSMAVAGPFVSWIIFKALKKTSCNRSFAIFLGAALGDLMTYVVTSFQLAMAYPDPTGGFSASLVKFMGIFAVTQMPLAISEGLLTVIVFNLLTKYNEDELIDLNIIAKGEM